MAKTETKKAPSTALSRGSTESTDLVTEKVTADVLLADADREMPFERDDLAIPFLRVLQKGSPEVNKRDPKYVDGAEPGMFINTVTKKVYDGEEGILVVPFGYTKSFTEWRTRDAGGGFVADHGANKDALKGTTRDDKGRDMTKDGTQITQAALYFLMLAQGEKGPFEQAAWPLASTQLKKARAWNSVIAGQRIRNPVNPDAAPIQPRPYYMTYRVTTVQESNDKGDWMGVVIEPYKPTLALPNGDELYMRAKDQEKLFQQGSIKTVPVGEGLGQGEDEIINEKF